MADQVAPTARTSSRHSFGMLVMLGAASSALFALAASRTWVTVTASDAAFSSQREQAISGADLTPWVASLAVVGLVAWGTVLFTRTVGRRVALSIGLLAQVVAAVGLVVTLTGSAVDDEVARRVGDVAATQSWSAWVWVAGVAATVAIAVAAVSLARCGSWPAMGSRYDAPTRSDDEPTDPWKQLDAGIDPTE